MINNSQMLAKNFFLVIYMLILMSKIKKLITIRLEFVTFTQQYMLFKYLQAKIIKIVNYPDLFSNGICQKLT